MEPAPEKPALPSTYGKRLPFCGRAGCFSLVKRTIVRGKDGSVYTYDDDFCSFHASERNHAIVRDVARGSR